MVRDYVQRGLNKRKNIRVLKISPLLNILVSESELKRIRKSKCLLVHDVLYDSRGNLFYPMLKKTTKNQRFIHGILQVKLQGNRFPRIRYYGKDYNLVQCLFQD